MLQEFNGHTTVIGRTQVGKTYTTVRKLLQQKQGVLFYNTQYEELPGYVDVYPDNCSYAQIERLLRKGAKVNFNPPSHPEERDKMLSLLVRKLLESGFDKQNFIFLAVDEAHLYTDKRVLPELIRIATGGMRFGIHGVWISQRPALIPNTLMTQSTSMMIFPCNMESQYFKSYGIPYSDMENEFAKNGPYSYCLYDFKDIEGHRKIT